MRIAGIRLDGDNFHLKIGYTCEAEGGQALILTLTTLNKGYIPN